MVEERDPVPRWLNAFHAVTRDGVVRREVLLREGEPYRRSLADETRRNLAALPQLSLVLVVAAEGSAPGLVRVLVVTKDVWSIRLDWDFSLGASGLERLSMNPAERNLLGTHQTLGAIFEWLPLSSALGARYVVPRIGASHVGASAQAGLVLGHGTGREGSFGGARVEAPLWSARTEWAWAAGGSWLRETSRLYSEGRLAAFALAPTDCAAAPARCVPWAYRTDVADASAAVTRSFGWATKLDVTLALGASRARYALPDLAAYDPATVAAFARTRVPVSEDRVGPSVQLRTYSSDFVRVLDLDTLALQEDWRVGPSASLRAYPVLRALGSSRDFLGLAAGAAYGRAVGDGLVRAGVDSVTEIEPDGDVRDASLGGSLLAASPRLRPGRLVAAALVADRWANHLNRLSALGGNGRLRGYPTDWLVGAHLLVVNLEARSRPLQVLESLQLGAVAFLDAGDAFDRWGALRLHRSAGAGARFLFPQLDRVVLRADVGFPLERPLPAGVRAADFRVTFGQAFP